MAPPVLAHPSRNILIEEGSFITGVRDEAHAGVVSAVDGEPTGCELPEECDDCRPCTTDTCEAEVCVHTNRPECDLCDDAFFCNGTDKCDDSGNCVEADQIKMYLCNDGPNQDLTCPKGDFDCAVCVAGDRDNGLCCPKDGEGVEGVCDVGGTCIGGERDGLECCPGGDCYHGTCKLQTVDPDPCRYFPALLCDETEEAGVGLTGACVDACFGGDCDDGNACNGGEICVKDSSRVGYGGQCVGGPTPKAPCSDDAACGAGGQCGGVCQADPANPPPCGLGVRCQEGPPVVCDNGRCCPEHSGEKNVDVCCRTDRPDCLANGCPGGTGQHYFLGVGDLPSDDDLDEGSCTVRSTIPPYSLAGESWACPKYSSGITSGDIVDIWGTTGVSTCHDYWEIGDDYRLENCVPGEWYEVHTIRWVGGHVRGFESRMRFTFYDQAGRFIEDVITEFEFPGGIEMRTVVFSEDPVIPCEGYITNKPAVQFSPANRAEWTTTDPANIQEGFNDPVNVVIRRHGVCDTSGAGCNEDADCVPPDAGECVIDDPELKWGAPLEVVSAASLGLQSGVLAFEIIGEKVTAPVGACCDVDTGKCLPELGWICEEAGNVFQGSGTSCNVCSDDPFLACDSESDCKHCEGGGRDGEVCCPDDGVCNLTGFCEGGSRPGEECCPDGACEATPVCLPSPPACQITACCDKATGDCTEVTGNRCVGGPDEGEECTHDDHCELGTCVRASGTCAAGGKTDGNNCISDNDCVGNCWEMFCAISGAPCQVDEECPLFPGDPLDVCEKVTDTDVPCTSKLECHVLGPNFECNGKDCEAPCPEGSNPQGFGTGCDPNCCEPPAYSGADHCSEADIVVINVPPLGGGVCVNDKTVDCTDLTEEADCGVGEKCDMGPVTYTFRGNNKNATFGDWVDPDAGGPGTCNWGALNPDGGTRDRGWWHAFSIDDCADVRLDLCCTWEISGEVHQPQWAVLFVDCNPCTANLGNSVTGPGSYPPEPIGSTTAGNDRGLPFCTGADDLWQTFRHLPKGIYWHPIYTAPGGHWGEYQFHITVGACADAACCLPETVCIGGPRHGESCADNIECAPTKADEVCVGDTNRPYEYCCPEGVCDNDPTDPVCLGGTRAGLACCDGGGVCKGNCVADCTTARQPDCEALGGFWMGFGNIPLEDAPLVECFEPPLSNPGTCRDWGSCCLGPGECQDWSHPDCDPTADPPDPNCCQDDGTNCMDRKLCTVLGGTFVAEAMCDYPLDPCPACEIQGDTNCTLCNNTDFLVTLSDLTVPPGGVVHADDFVPEGTTIDTLCVWGTYLDGASPPGPNNYSCSGAVEDNFRVRIYTDGKGMPGDQIAERWIEDPPKSDVPDCPNWIGVYEDNLRLEVFTLSFPAITVAAGQTHWLEVANKTDYLAGGTEPTSNACYWHWMQVWWGAPDGSAILGNRVSATGSDDRCLGGYYDKFPCDSQCTGGGECDRKASICIGGDRSGQNCCPGGICKKGQGGGYIAGSQRWAGQMFCLGNMGAGVNFTPGDVITGCCCSCDGTAEDGVAQVDCADLSAGSDRRWYPNQTCTEIGNCTNLAEPGDDCGAAAVGTVAAAGTDCTPPQPEPGACVEITDGLYAINTACTNTDGTCCPTGQQGNQLGEDVWYCYTTTCTGQMILSMCNSSISWGGMDSYLAIHHDFDHPNDCPCPGQTTQFQVAESDEGCNGIADGGAGTFGPQIVFPGECWLIRAGGWGDSAAATDHGPGMVSAGCTPAACFPASTPVLEHLTNGVDGTFMSRKNRFISVSLPDARPQAIRVVVGPKPDPVKPGKMPPPFDLWQGQEMYAGEPRQYCENAGQGPTVAPNPNQGGVSASWPCGPASIAGNEVYANGQQWFWAAPLVCDKGQMAVRDWTTLADHCNTPNDPNFDGWPCESDDDCGTGTCGVSPVVHLYQEVVVPSHLSSGAGPIDIAAVYEVSAIDSSCPLNVESSYSAPAQLHQAGFGDVVNVVANWPNGPPNQIVGVTADTVALLNKFSNVNGPVQKVRADIVPCKVDFTIGIPDIVATLNAFVGQDYEGTCGTGQCSPLNLCSGGGDHGQPCLNDDDCNSDPCYKGMLEVAGK